MTVLISISTVMTLLRIIVPILRAFNDSILPRIIIHIIGSIDVYTNFINVILMNKAFDRYYIKFCGSLDIRCRKCWMRRLDSVQNEKQLANNITAMVAVETDGSAVHSKSTNKTPPTFPVSIE